MLRFTSAFLLCLIFISCSKSDLDTAPNEALIQEVKTFGGSKNDLAKSVLPTNDGGFIVIGSTQSSDGDISTKNNESYDFWVLKFSADNLLEWQKTYGGTGDDRGRDIAKTSDGGYLLVGYSDSSDGDVTNNNGLRDFWVVKIDATGNLIWEKSFGYSGIDEGNTIIKTSDNNFIVSGVLDVTASNGEGNLNKNTNRHAGGDYWNLKISNNGDLIWARYYGGTFTDTALGLAENESGEIITIGSSDSNDVDIKNNKGSYDFWVVNSAANGNLIWEKSFGGSEIDEARGIVKVNDGFIIAGDTRSIDKDVSLNNGGADLWLIKVNETGNLIWEKSFGGSNFDVARSINKTNDNGFIIAGSSRSANGDVALNNGQNDAWIITVNESGNLLWQTTIGGSKIDFAYDAIQKTNGDYIIVGESQSNDGDVLQNKGFSDLLIITLK